jgi:glycosyltransferase involved in cell wall biosynthesis
LVNAWGTDIQIEPKKSRVLRIFAKLTIRRADAVIVDSEVQRRDLLELGCDPRKICCFPWGIDLDKFRPQDSTAFRRELGWLDKKIVLSTRSHVERCGVEYLIRAIPQILEQEANARFLIVGDGPLLDYHKSLAKTLEVEKQTRFLGWVQNDRLPEILCATDLYVSTSFSDGSSASLLEAMACGLPVVVTAIPGNKEWVSEGKNGQLVPPGDNGKLCRSIVRVLLDDELRSRMRRESLRIAKDRADWKRNALVLQRCVFDLMTSVK